MPFFRRRNRIFHHRGPKTQFSRRLILRTYDEKMTKLRGGSVPHTRLTSIIRFLSITLSWLGSSINQNPWKR